MKVLFTFGGLPHYYNLVLNKLNRIPGLQVLVAVPDNRGKTLGSGVYESSEGIEFKVIRLEEYKPIYGKPALKGLAEVIKEEKPDVIVTVWPYVINFIYSRHLMSAVRKTNAKLIYKDIPFNIPKYEDSDKYYEDQRTQVETLESDKGQNKLLHTLKYRLVKWARKKYFNLMDAHVYYTEEAYDIIPTYGVPKEKIHIIYNSPDTDHLLEVSDRIRDKSPVLSANNYRLLHVGRLVKWKRVDMLIEAFAKLKKKFPEAELVIIGTGPEEEALKKQVKELNLENCIFFIGGVYDPHLLGQYFLSSSIYVLAGMGGLSINEAMCFGKPIICSVADGTEKALVREGFNGKYFKNGDMMDLYQQIDYLLSRPEEIKRYGENSLKIIKEEINIHTVISNYVKTFNYVTNNRENITYTF